MEWPALSPYLDPMENQCGTLTRNLYANGHQLAAVQESKLQIERNWFSLKLEFLQTLVLSMPDRVFQMIRKNCSKI